MGKRVDRVCLVDMLVHAKEAIALLGEASQDELASDRVLQLALERLIEIVGEAANRISSNTQQRHAQIPWPQIIGMHNRLVHGYNAMNLDRLWDTITYELPLLIEQLGAIVGKD